MNWVLHCPVKPVPTSDDGCDDHGEQRPEVDGHVEHREERLLLFGLHRTVKSPS